MIQPEDFRYTLVIDKKEYILPHSPSGWEESLLNWERSNDLFGMIRTFSVPMVFVLDGAWLLRGQFYEHGIKAETIIRIDQLNRATWQYVNMYAGEIDYSTFTDRMHDVEVSVMEGGISKMIKAYEKVQYEIPLDDPEAITIQLPGIGLLDKANFVSAEQQVNFDSDFILLSQVVTPDVTISLDELVNNYLTSRNVSYQKGSLGDLANAGNWIIQAEQDTNVSFTGNIKGSYQKDNANSVIVIEVRNANLQRVGTIANFIVQGQHGFDIDFTISNYDISAGEQLFFVIGLKNQVGGSETGWLRISETVISVTNNIVTDDTLTLAFRPFTLFERLLAKMNNGFAVTAQSFILNNKNWRRLAITSGDAIRKINDPKLKTSFRDFFDSMNAVIGVGFGVENGTAVLEEKAYFMRKGLQAVHIGEVKEFNLEPAINFIYNSIKVGYANQNYEARLGREEYNSTQIWSTPITRVQRELNLISPYRADQLGIEDLRLTPEEENNNETDNSSDNDVFMIKIQVEPVDGLYQVEGIEAYQPIEGIKGVEQRLNYYNLDITPKKNLIRHGNFLRSMLHHYDGQHIRFESAEKNQTLETIDLDKNKVKENEWLPISSLGDRLFLPYIATVTSALPKNTAELITNFPTGYIGFRYMGHEYKGFIMSASVDVARNSEREFKLLMTPDNNLLNLVH